MVEAMEIARRQLIGLAGKGPRLLVTAGVHGDEFEPMAAVRQLMRTLEPRDLQGELVLAPVVNEPAFARGRRTAEDGLDLARSCPGRAEGSITERIAEALSRLIRTADFYIDLHTGGTALVIVPLAGYMLHADARVLEAQRRMARAFDFPLVWGTSARLEGRSLSVARDANVPAIYVEHGGGGTCDPAKVKHLVDGCLNVMAELGMIDARVLALEAPESRVRHVVEDDRADSGHLQINHPAPADGFFEPAVELGQKVSGGQLLGQVVDVLGDAAVPVQATHSGIVAVLRSLRSVRRGDALATIVETGEILGLADG